MDFDLAGFLREERLAPGYAKLVARLHVPLAERIGGAARRRRGAFIVGLTGPQGSGKTTTAAVLARLLAARGVRAAILSLDDLYLPLAERRRLAREVHPLLLTRGPPGTHDVALGMTILRDFGRAGETLVPRFDKASDDRTAPEGWRSIQGPAKVILFEGWCVGARPQTPGALAAPVNDLERERDPQGLWRTHVNDALAGPYQDLFGPLDFQVLFTAPDFEAVRRWRVQQEQRMRARLTSAEAEGRRGLTDDEVAVFVQHYERLTRHIQAEAPSRADVVVRLGRDRRVLGVAGLY